MVVKSHDGRRTAMQQPNGNAQILQIAPEHQAHRRIWELARHHAQLVVCVLATLALDLHVGLPAVDPEIWREPATIRQQEGPWFVAPAKAVVIKPSGEMNLESSPEATDIAIPAAILDRRPQWLPGASAVRRLELASKTSSVTRVGGESAVMVLMKIRRSGDSILRVLWKRPGVPAWNSAVGQSPPNDSVGTAEPRSDGAHRQPVFGVEPSNLCVVDWRAGSRHLRNSTIIGVLSIVRV